MFPFFPDAEDSDPDICRMPGTGKRVQVLPAMAIIKHDLHPAKIIQNVEVWKPACWSVLG